MRKEERVQRKRIPRVSSDNGVARTPKTRVSRRKGTENDRHWDFLDEIEAPMWVDLTLECQSGYNDKDDEWFHTNHQFHQFSSRQLIAAFSRSAEDCINLELNIQEQSSPKLPPSVSKSRGKDYRIRDKILGNQMVQHPVKNFNKRSPFVNSGSNRMTSSKTSNERTMALAGSKSDSRGESNITENAGQHNFRIVLPLADQKFTSNSNFSKKGESSSTSTITSEGSEQQQQKPLEVSSHGFGQARGFLSALRVSLRKSCVTRQASRVEVTNGRVSEGQKSSSSISSIGSSTNLDYDRKILTARDNKDMTPDSRNVRIPVVCHQKVHEANLSNAPGVRPHYTIYNPKSRGQSFKSPSINQGNANVKFQQQTLPAKVLVPHGVNKQCPPAAAVKVEGKAVASNSGRIPACDKENPAAKVASSKKSIPRNTMQAQKRVPGRSIRTKLVGPKERINDRSKGKKTGTMAEKVYFR